MSKEQQRWIFHITHVDNLASIIEERCLLSDRRLVDTHEDRVVIGMDHIKKRRLEELPVHCHPNTFVGDYVPFYFCPRSPMLYMIRMKNNELKFQNGQERIVHLVTSLDDGIEASGERPWAFSDGNAGARYTQFSNDINQLSSFINWNAVHVRKWSGLGVDPAIKDKKQAEFLVHDSFPWEVFRGIGVINESIRKEVEEILENADHKPKVLVKRDWYY